MHRITQGAALVAALWTAPASASDGVQERVQIPAHVLLQVQARGCSSAAGPTLSLGGSLQLGELSGRLTFQGRARADGSRDETVVGVSLLQGGAHLGLARRPALGAEGGDAYMFLQLVDEYGQPLGEEVFLGQCGRGVPRQVTLDVDLDLDVTSRVRMDGCSARSPQLRVEGLVTLGGLEARIRFAEHRDAASEGEPLEVVLLEPGEELAFRRNPPFAGVTGNPHVYYQVADELGRPRSYQAYLGRCREL